MIALKKNGPLGSARGLFVSHSAVIVLGGGTMKFIVRSRGFVSEVINCCCWRPVFGNSVELGTSSFSSLF